MMNEVKQHDNSIIAVLLLICFVCAVFLAAILLVNRLTTDSCFNTLDDATAQVADALRTSMESDREQLEVMADLLSQHDMGDTEMIQGHLAAFHQHGTISDISLLMPEGSLILGPGEGNTLEGVLDYAGELAKAPYVSPAIIQEDGTAYFYQAVPLKQDGQTLGILYGFVNLSDLRDSLTVTAFDGHAQIYVADRETGDFLVDTLHDTLGNIFDKSVMSRKVKSGFDYQQMKTDFHAGKSGHIAFWSYTVEEWLYSCYMPVGFSDWMIQMTVPESVVFAEAFQIRSILLIVSAAELLSLAVYFIFVLSRVRKDVAQKNQRLEQVVFMYDIQQTLFDAHKDPTLFTMALQKVAEKMTADVSLFLRLENGAIGERFFSTPVGPRASAVGGSLSEAFPNTFQRLSAGKSLILYPKEIRTSIDAQDQAVLAKNHVQNLMIVPVLNSGGELTGLLASINMKRRWADSTMLECVSSSFLMTLNSMIFYRQIEHLSMVDAMTGLRNRNCYEQALENYLHNPLSSLCCLYIDANGLHELNNTLGHAAGDAMLIAVGDAMRALFPPLNCYRIGGDEFAAFATDCTREELRYRRE